MIGQIVLEKMSRNWSMNFTCDLFDCSGLEIHDGCLPTWGPSPTTKIKFINFRVVEKPFRIVQRPWWTRLIVSKSNMATWTSIGFCPPTKFEVSEPNTFGIYCLETKVWWIHRGADGGMGRFTHTPPPYICTKGQYKTYSLARLRGRAQLKPAVGKIWDKHGKFRPLQSWCFTNNAAMIIDGTCNVHYYDAMISIPHAH